MKKIIKNYLLKEIKLDPKKTLVLISLILLGISIFLPLWSIKLTAPQYPDGLSLQIFFNEIAGGQKSTIQNVNILNHYIGMAPINIDVIPEFKYLIYVQILLVACGAYIYIKSFKLKSLIKLFALQSIFCLFCLYDFWLWLYTYGHDLDPSAAIKIPGMSYQPPIIGTKNLLNFTVVSLPSYGVISITLALIILLYVICHKKDILPTEFKRSDDIIIRMVKKK